MRRYKDVMVAKSSALNSVLEEADSAKAKGNEKQHKELMARAEKMYWACEDEYRKYFPENKK